MAQVTEDRSLALIRSAHGGTLGSASLDEVRAAIARLESSLPMKQLDDAAQTEALNMVVSALAPIGAKLNPGMSPEKASAWCDAIAVSLSKYPARVAIHAAKEGQTEPFRYIGDVDARLHEIAQDAMDRNAVALIRLRAFRDDIERANQPKLPMSEVPPLTIDEISRVPDAYIRMGLSLGEITQEQVEEAEKLKAERAAKEHIDTSQDEAHTAPTEGKPVGEHI